ncbi:DeoR/GlpR family DNA-binding transcription regulator [Granulosicoccus sp.]|nr:DeoR/GlpR family DNA-binding transcription regulator [Granulosicoccus sp.]MDB4223426.1 DeoR/GlpR family DNA-binding transcription regulator [Granulosicoccus sp.]
MLTQERKQYLLQVLKQQGKIEAKSIAAELGLSDDTIRRDLRELASAGKLQRVHGGALPKSPADADLEARQSIASRSKQQIGKTAASLIEPEQVVIIDGGTTAMQLIKNLSRNQRNTIVTHSPTIAVALAPYPLITVVMIGGTLFRHSMVNVGAATVEAVSHIHADTFFMGVTGVDVKAGLSTGDLEEALVKRALSLRAADTIIMASSEKLGVASPYVVMPLDNASGIVLDRKIPPSIKKLMKNSGLDVYV